VKRDKVSISTTRRTEHIAILGKTGTGKSSILRSFCAQDIAADRGFVFFDLHGDATPYILRQVAMEERRTNANLADKLIVIDPADEEWSVGLNILKASEKTSIFVRIAEFAELLKSRWRLDALGSRTEEVLRNALHVLAVNDLTLLELGPLLVDPAFRAGCLAKISNSEIKEFFISRYDRVGESMRTVLREPILNKTSTFTADPHFRHIVGQAESTFSLQDAMTEGKWIVLNLHKGRLGEEAVTLGSLFLALIKDALFARKAHNLFTIYCDEIQNFVSSENSLDTIFAESRKFGISIVSANQFLDQYPVKMRAAVLALGTHLFFQLSSFDAHQIALALDGGKPLAELLKNLPRRHMIVKAGSNHWQEVLAPNVEQSHIDFSNLYDRSRTRWARRRAEIEADINQRRTALASSTRSTLARWE